MDTTKEVVLPYSSIPDNRNYWFVRTQGGTLFSEFIAGSFIAIGWNSVTKKIIENSKDRDELKNFIKEHFPKEKRNGLTVTHLLRFVKEMKVGDFVIIPSKGSKDFAFGQIAEDVYEENVFEPEKCDFKKRRKVSWIKNIPSDKIERQLSNIKYSESAVNLVNQYANYIDRYIGGCLYEKGGITNLVFNAGVDGNIKLKDLNEFLTATLNLVQVAYPDIDIDTLSIKLSLQSRGKIQLICAVASVGLLIAGALYLGGMKNSVKITYQGQKVDISAEGPTLVDEIVKYQDALSARNIADENAKLDLEIKRFHFQQEKLKASLPIATPNEKEKEQPPQ